MKTLMNTKILKERDSPVKHALLEYNTNSQLSTTQRRIAVAPQVPHPPRGRSIVLKRQLQPLRISSL